MPDEAPEVPKPDVPQSLSKEELDAMLGEQATSLESKIDEKLEAIKQELTPAQQEKIKEDGWPWENNPNFNVNTVADLMGWVDKFYDKKLSAREEELKTKVIEKLAQDQAQYQQDLQESNKILTDKIEKTKVEDPNFDENNFYKVIGDWNLKHPNAKLEDYDAAYDFYKQIQMDEKPTEKKAKKAMKIVGAPSAGEAEDNPKQMYFPRTSDAVRAAIADFQTGYEE